MPLHRPASLGRRGPFARAHYYSARSWGRPEIGANFEKSRAGDSPYNGRIGFSCPFPRVRPARRLRYQSGRVDRAVGVPPLGGSPKGLTTESQRAQRKQEGMSEPVHLAHPEFKRRPAWHAPFPLCDLCVSVVSLFGDVQVLNLFLDTGLDGEARLKPVLQPVLPGLTGHRV